MGLLKAEAAAPGMRGAPGRWSAGRAAEQLGLPRVLIQTFVLGLPLWWVLGIDWAFAPTLALCLVLSSLSTYRQFTLPDHLILALILCLTLTAYINGLLIARETTRFLAALYNVTVLASAFILMKAVREQLKVDPGARRLLKSCVIAFFLLTAVVWTCVALAFAFGRFAMEIPSVFGLVFGNFVPDSAPLIRDSTRLTFSQADWGLPGVPMPRIAVYGPYPTATSATIAVLGSMTLLYLQRHGGWRNILIPATELLIIATIATTLTRSILGGWLIGAIVANLIFGSPFRRVFACAVLVGALLAVPTIEEADQTLEYRAYSSESRFENYFYAARLTFQSNPVFGLGIKPREEGNHIAVGSHSTFVSSFTKGGVLGLSLVLAFFVLTPAMRWFVIVSGVTAIPAGSSAELRILLNLQITIWIWLGFEDIDAPASAALLIFFAWAFIEQSLRMRADHASRRSVGLRSSRPHLGEREVPTNAAG